MENTSIGEKSSKPFIGQQVATPGFGRGWMRVAKELSTSMSWRDIAHIWVFPPIRTDGREWGTAVIARNIKENRVAVSTARYMVLTRGKKRGHGKVEIEQVGESPEDVVSDVLRGVQERAGEADPPIEIEPTLWFGAEDDEPTTQS